MKTLRSLEIVDYLKERKHCSMGELMERFAVSPATLHRDISELTRRKLIQKVHGGVALAAPPEPRAAPAFNSHFLARVDKDTDKKARIAALAARKVAEGDIVFLDSSTTALHLAREIQSLELPSLTLITNSVLVIQEFHLFPPRFFLLSPGGNYNLQLNSFLGRSAIERMRELKVNKAFISSVGVSAAGFSTYHEDHAEFLKEVLATAQETYLLADSTKFGKEGLFRIGSLSDVTALISDQPPPPDIAAKTACLC